MYLSGIAVTLAGTYLSDGAEIKEKGFFYGYTYYVWFVIFLASVGGLYTSVVVKYTDNIMKGFCGRSHCSVYRCLSHTVWIADNTFIYTGSSSCMCFHLSLWVTQTRYHIHSTRNNFKRKNHWCVI